MYTATLHEIGGSVMLAIHATLLRILGLSPGMSVGLCVEGGRLRVRPRARPRYKLRDLLSPCDTSAPEGEEEAVRGKRSRAWRGVGLVA